MRRQKATSVPFLMMSTIQTLKKIRAELRRTEKAQRRLASKNAKDGFWAEHDQLKNFANGVNHAILHITEVEHGLSKPMVEVEPGDAHEILSILQDHITASIDAGDHDCEDSRRDLYLRFKKAMRCAKI
jgi:hypothetical protein